LPGDRPAGENEGREADKAGRAWHAEEGPGGAGEGLADEPVLSARELTARLDWQLLTVSASDVVPVEFSYGAGELFGYHGVTVEVDCDLRFRDIELRG
jgi:hypothetical protein